MIYDSFESYQKIRWGLFSEKNWFEASPLRYRQNVFQKANRLASSNRESFLAYFLTDFQVLWLIWKLSKSYILFI